MRIVFMGTPDFAVNVLQGLIDNYKDEIVGVVSQPDKRVGRHQILTNTPVKELALKYNIPVFQPVKIREDYEDVISLKPDLIVTCAYGQIIPKEILDVTGVTIMYMDVGMDTGDMISKVEVPILDSDNLESLHDKLSDAGTKLLLDTLPSIIDGTNNREAQNSDDVTYAYNIKREEERIDFNKTSREVFNLIRGLCPVPCSNAILDGKEMKIYSSEILEGKHKGKCGEIVDITKSGLVVVCSDGAIIIKEVKPFGKKKMDAYSYANGVGKDNLIGKVFNNEELY